MTSLYAIADEYQSILDSLEDGELDDTALERLESVEHSLTEKAQNVAAYIRNAEELAKSIKEAEAAMRKRRQAMEGRIAWLKSYLLRNMEATGITKIECPWFKLSVRKNPVAVQVTDIAAVPDDAVTVTLEIPRHEYLRIRHTLAGLSITVRDEKVDKFEIKERIQGGKKIEGAKLTQTKRVQIG